jgi:hypothetical protein
LIIKNEAAQIEKEATEIKPEVKKAEESNKQHIDPGD